MSIDQDADDLTEHLKRLLDAGTITEYDAPTEAHLLVVARLMMRQKREMEQAKATLARIEAALERTEGKIKWPT